MHTDITAVRNEEGKLYLFVAIDRTSKFAYVELHNSSTKPIAAEFLCNLIKILPYKIHTVLTDNGIQFTNQERHKYAFKHIFDRVCEENSIDLRKLVTAKRLKTLNGLTPFEFIRTQCS